MRQYRVTKYNPAFRDARGAYLKDEWTDFSCIGKAFDGHILTEEEYCEVENHYIQACIDAWERQGCPDILVKDIEKRSFILWVPKIIKDKKHLSGMIKNILEMKLWARLECENFFIHFGYDFYMYIGTLAEPSEMLELATTYNLYCEEMPSPYLQR